MSQEVLLWLSIGARHGRGRIEWSPQLESPPGRTRRDSRLTFASPTGKLSIRPSTGVSGQHEEPGVSTATQGKGPTEERFALCP